MATDDRKFTLSEAKKAGFVSDYSPKFLGKNLLNYSNEDLLRKAGASENKLLPEKFYIDTFRKYIQDINSQIDWLAIPDYYKGSKAATNQFFENIQKNIKTEREREVNQIRATTARAKAGAARATRSVGGLLASAASPNLGDAVAGGQPILGDQPMLGESSALGMRRVL